ncbi:MAG: acetyl-CoA carboxylase biotin carboxyl carrier protein [Flavobacteriales bacterium]|nr:acetyl-CoA carboxylase biotin carboxyl carrier protein [Flavobacteriales bacterium]
MDLNQIQSLIKFVSKSGVNEVELETKDFKINIKTTKAGDPATQVMMPAQAYMPAQPAAPAPAPAPAAPAASSEGDKAKEEDNSKYITVKSPMIGTFYRSANPESDSFVNVGDEISPGKVICIIEAMKLFNEIEAEVSGKIVKVLADDASPVEYDQPLFLVDPS